MASAHPFLKPGTPHRCRRRNQIAASGTLLGGHAFHQINFLEKTVVIAIHQLKRISERNRLFAILTRDGGSLFLNRPADRNLVPDDLLALGIWTTVNPSSPRFNLPGGEMIRNEL